MIINIKPIINRFSNYGFADVYCLGHSKNKLTLAHNLFIFGTDIVILLINLLLIKLYFLKELVHTVEAIDSRRVFLLKECNEKADYAEEPRLPCN